MENISNFAVDKSKYYMGIASKATKLTKELESNSVINNNSDVMMRYFHEQMKINQQFSAIYYAKNNGEFNMLLKNKNGYMEKTITIKDNIRVVRKLSYNKVNNKKTIIFDKKDIYDPRIRPWFIKAVKTKLLNWTDPYVFFTSKKPGITTSIPIFEGGILKGVIGIDIEIDELSTFINKLKISENGKVFMMDKSLNMMSFPIKDINSVNKKPRLLKLKELDNDIVKKAYSELLKIKSIETFTEKTFLTFTHQRENYTAMFFPFTKNDITWIIGMYAPENDYLGLIKKNQELGIFITIFIGFISIFLIYKIAGIIAKPIRRLENMAYELKEMNLDVKPIEHSPIIEINEAIDSFNTMKDSLKTNQQILENLNLTLEEKVEKKTYQLKELNDKLEEKIEERVLEIKEKDSILIQQTKMAAMGEMLQNIAHQWRQPLSSISTASTGVKLLNEMHVLKDSDLNKSMDSINDSAQYLSQTIEDFRGFFDPRNSKQKEFKISDALDKTLKLVKSQFVSKEIEIIKYIEDISIVSIENELIQVLVNILNNSRDALMKIENQKKMVFINVYKRENKLVIEIKDNAKGIKEEIIYRIFEPYFTTKHQSQGTGVGLYMSENIIRTHLKGTINVKNETYIYNEENYTGAKFTIEINLI
jgi:signal transduction histidine kinase